MNKFETTYRKIVRNIQRRELSETIFEENLTLTDIIEENILQSPYMLIDDIIKNLENDKLQFMYGKYDLKKLSNKDWKYYDDVDKLNEDFSLTIINCNECELRKKFKNINPTGMMMEFCQESSTNSEFIWIGKYFENDYRCEDFKNLLKHELGHVWTFIFNDENAEGPTNEKSNLDFDKLTNFQKDVFLTFYNGNRNILKLDYEYVLCKNENESGNFELPVHIDNIIEILIADYLEINNKLTPETYLRTIFNSIENKIERNSLLNSYKNNILYSNYKEVESVKNPIRRLYLLFAFGTTKQIEYFKEAAKKEFEMEV